MDKIFKSFFLEKDNNNKQINSIKEISKSDLMEGDVTVSVTYSSLNYKDGLAITGKLPIVKKWPMIPGVDFCGTVVESSNQKFKKGSKVLLNGWGVGEKHYGGFSQVARVKSDWLIPLPENIDEIQSMIIGSGGYTAMLCVIEVLKNINKNDGEILVTGASGGVGSFSIYLLSKLGYKVSASTGKINESSYLKSIGASKIIDRNEFDSEPKALDKERWTAVIDSVGGKTLSNILTQTKYDGLVISVGLAQSPELITTVFPFILRNITLKGIDCVYASYEKRIEAWNKLGSMCEKSEIKSMGMIKSLTNIESLSKDIIEGKIKGRIVIDVNE